MSQYAHALAAAIDTARAAGDLLRADFHLPTGPRGAVDHADADDEAEALIRQRLLAACNWGYLGEETGRQAPPAGEKHYWVVDPNDGTRWYLRGYRGSAVSIAALRDGVPILGVIYAFAAPDDEGDLIAWAEGCGPITRNGRPCTTSLAGVGLEPGQYALMSYDADDLPGLNLKLTAPARYIAVASLAYRMALAAVGEGVVGVSLSRKPKGAVSWDYAAGHALLRAAGGTLVNQRGEEVTYAADAASETRFTFGGPLEVARAMASRPWDDVFAAEDPPSDGSLFGTTRLTPGQTVRDPGLLARAQGCLLGQLAGDSLGSLVEFEEPQEIAAAYPQGVRDLQDGGVWRLLAGQPTDDSELALLLARSLVAEGRYDAEAVRKAYVHWYQSRPFDIGFTTSSALGSGKLVHDSEANGSLMRISPLGIFAAALADPSAALEHARADSRLTHPNPVCQESCAAYVAALAAAIRGQGAEGAYEAALETARRGGQPSVVEALTRARQAAPLDFLTQQGWVLIALQNAFYRLLSSASLEEGLVATVGEGGDTDTTAAIAGALLGAVHGREAIPAAWRRAILACRPVPEAGAQRPRMRDFWPIDALALVERLLLAGQQA